MFPVQGVLGCPGGDYVGENTYYANGDGAFCLNIAPALNQYELVLPDPEEGTDGDFTFADVTLPDGTLFYSESLLEAWEQNLQLGTPAVNTDDADKLFEETYGKLYRLPSLFANGYDIYFCVKDGKIVLPAGFDAQATGLSKLGQKLSIVINASKSEFNEATNEVSLSVELISADGKLSFGKFSEVLSATVPDFEVAANLDLARDFNYTTQFNDTFKSGIVGESWKTDFQTGTATDSQKGALFEAAYGKAYCLPNLYTPNYNIYFCGKDGEVSVPADYQVQPTGLEMFGTKIYATVVSGYGRRVRCDTENPVRRRIGRPDSRNLHRKHRNLQLDRGCNGYIYEHYVQKSVQRCYHVAGGRNGFVQTRQLRRSRQTPRILLEFRYQ